MTLFPTVAAFEAALDSLSQPDMAARDAAAHRQGQLTKPPGSLGRLEDIAVFFAGWQGVEHPRITRGRAVIFAGNHGVVARGVSAFPAEVTAQMVANFIAGGAAINALAAAAGLELSVVPLDLDRPTVDFTTSPAMSEAECLAALTAGAEAVGDADLLVLGEMGIGNTTPAAALAAASFGGDAALWVGPGTGVDAQGLSRKAMAVTEGLTLHREHLTSAFEILRRLGGREIAAMAGAVLAARIKRIPVVLDGFIGTAAIAPLASANPNISAHCLSGHCSAEPGHTLLLARLGLEPILSLKMRLGEGSGAAVAVQVIRSALAAHDGMATFAEAGVATA
ncbi:nicotinate-nucleotide--dimethylbenzimidazole phosphoribosyltransferase [Sphingomonas sanguinis]|jgi:nicotinate-nucleotide--dimethylbenzimidazole phosphoribosyltransferase|uniref:Nicotinate-nucleotide--dimethylbenzimidazole phosphoribosyltransferase n=1 Tax=Sphingomonas sanguinis TaxID=33051 RepID=A0A7Y7QVX5_9SPHN|nr:nicotinate-nucleotide--dimethylbenzimidazole phosphoribosyltransferase [Sphingomonas sanguinis]MBZ6382040.1 nicotinate-nucleotide--dimethylbenzimidazole phosphoribosyltransferase [Sphingomonas sanguinis]NNG49154.1 nicotinate-nucleotide--dimethylbenzimidazole phosphoribosyltransferase [Sphingomonas sanguinis]NNG52595.1 nicotinate-nucleotide--dimethylbenzimidazole phosphoribosyltransferase [Sphingomonas sanguinis]NVP31339.1 nicotinate-nucleotide--dimethylbenzimidazole phosphoribosyltransferase